MFLRYFKITGNIKMELFASIKIPGNAKKLNEFKNCVVWFNRAS